MNQLNQAMLDVTRHEGNLIRMALADAKFKQEQMYDKMLTIPAHHGIQEEQWKRVIELDDLLAKVREALDRHD